jgi:hypothetical protein
LADQREPLAIAQKPKKQIELNFRDYLGTKPKAYAPSKLSSEFK